MNDNAKTLNDVFASRLEEVRSESGLNRSDLATLLNKSKSLISMYEGGHRMPSPDLIVAIAQYFNVSVDWLLGLTNNKLPAVDTNSIPLGRTVKVPVVAPLRQANLLKQQKISQIILIHQLKKFKMAIFFISRSKATVWQEVKSSTAT